MRDGDDRRLQLCPEAVRAYVATRMLCVCLSLVSILILIPVQLIYTLMIFIFTDEETYESLPEDSS